MYAILKHSGHQYRVAPGDRLLVDRLPADVGATVELGQVLFLNESTESGSAGAVGPKDARVTAVVVSHRRGPKLRVFTYKAKKRRRRTLGYRSDLTELRIEAVLGAADKPSRATRSAKPAVAADGTKD